MQVTFIAFITMIAFSMVYGDDAYPLKHSGIYYGCRDKSGAFCNDVCKLHLARRGNCYQPGPLAKMCRCFGIDNDNISFFAAMEKQCPKLRG
uniref:Venom lipolysis activating peptide beta subunit n=1 Tax=Mesobuthus eupeus TaxID=34648 RepID=E4VP64_MESEU|nr:venom lipolysis activating peptide beta subunit [Mesobuthus eupeus]